ncbi:hypothetical protein CNR22_07580 [Sphingobacteriaceae bacterium]|nr:hypothetical protein CNR22_07580 [Sphingobacteriaceae bacterium]
MKRNILLKLFLFSSFWIYSQTPPNTIVIPNPTPNPPYISTNTYTRAVTSIKLQDGFKYGYVTGMPSATNLLNLSLGNNPQFVSSGYLGSGSNPTLIDCGSVPSVDLSKPVGETAGGFQVTQNGAASYNISITVSPGTRGVEPRLGLSYNSQGGLGLLGVGWSFTGLSAISRTGKIPMHDGNFSSPQLATSDVYALDGNRLFALSGSYGQANTTYYTESENFATITSFGTSGNGPERFEVQDKNGNILKYGNANNSSLKGVGDNTTLTWYLNEFKDEFGNYMTYSYKVLSGEVVIDKIEYTGNVAAALSPYNKITFMYIPLAEHNKTYILGKEFNQTQLMKEICCWAGTTMFKKYILDYEWNGSTYLSTVKELDANGNELNPTKFCWNNPNDFDGTKTAQQNVDANFSASDYVNLRTIAVDFNGDGFSDFACWNTESTGVGRHRVYQNTFLSNYGSNNTTINFANIYDNANQISNTESVIFSSVSDENRDGKQELFTITADLTTTSGGFNWSDNYTLWKTYLDVNNNIQVVNLGTTTEASTAFDIDNSPPQLYFSAGDYTGDGLTDNVIIDNERISITTGGNTYTKSFNAAHYSFMRPFNFDGDLATDYIDVVDNNTYLDINVHKFTGTSFYTSITGHNTIAFTDNANFNKYLCNHIAFGDLNGDGLDDLVYIDEYNSSMYMMKNTGNNFSLPELVQVFTPLGGSNLFDISCVDVNSDGKQDIVINERDAVNNTTIYYSYLSYGDLIIKGGSYIGNWKIGEANRVSHFQFSRDVSDDQRIHLRFGKGSVLMGTEIHSADFNGDGIYDYVNFDSNSNFMVTNTVNGEPRLSVTNIYTPFRNNIKIRYANLASRFSVSNGIKDEILRPLTSVGYSGGIGILLPNMYCVSYVFKNSGYSGQFQSNIRYLYKDPTYHQFGRGFLGFGEVSSIDLTTMIGSVNTASVDPSYFLLTGYKMQTSKFTNAVVSGLSNSNTYFPDATKIMSSSQSEVNYVPRNTSGYFSQLLKTESTDFLGSTRKSEEYTYDMLSHGNIQVQTSKAGWNLNSPILTSTKNFTYAIYNGVYKPVRQYNINNQAGESNYEREVVFTYDTQGRLTSTINDQNISTLSSHILTTAYTNFNNFGQATKVTISAPDITSRISETLYDATGRFVIKNINALGDFSESTYEPLFGKMIQSKDITGLITNYQYNGYGSLIKTLFANNTQSKITYAWESPTNYPYDSQIIGAYSLKTETDQQPYVKEYYTGNNLKLRSESQDYAGSIVVSDNGYDMTTTFPVGTLLETTEVHYPSQTKYLKTVYDYEYVYYRPTGNTTYSVNGSASTNTGIFTQTNYNTPSNSTYNSCFVEKTSSTGLITRNSLNSAGQLTLVTNTYPGRIQKATYSYFSNGQIKNTTLTTPSNPSQNIVYTNTYNDLGQKIQVTDPSRGTSTYQYSTLGELLQSNEQAGTFTYIYDVLGRVDTRTGSGSGTSTYEYFTSGNGMEQLKKITGPVSTTEYLYDNYNQITETKETITSGNKILKSNYAYDSYGREVQHTYPNSLVTKNVYNSLGHLTTITDVNNQTLWQLTTKDALGRIKEYTYGNNISTKNIYNDLNYLVEINHGNGSKHKQTYDYDLIKGNLLSRRFDNYLTNVTLKDVFNYDIMNRLSSWQQEDVVTNGVYNGQAVSIDILGNITQKSDAGTYAYSNPSKPFTLTQITNASSNISVNTLNMLYNDLEKVSQLSEMSTNKQMDFTYGNSDNRIKMQYALGGTNQYTRYYSEGYDREETTNTYKEWTYIQAPTGLCAVYFNNNGTTQLNYVVSDHLGSPVLLMSNSTSSPTLVEEYAFDAWGRRRNPSDWSYTNVPAATKMIRGFTLHEHLEDFSMINMNARIYDPVLGRFLQADNIVTDESNIQTFNIYAYCQNNPLKYSDPTGHYEEVPGTADALDTWYSNVGTAVYATNQYQGEMAYYGYSRYDPAPAGFSNYSSMDIGGNSYNINYNYGSANQEYQRVYSAAPLPTSLDYGGYYSSPLPVLGPALQSGALLDQGDYIGAAAYFGYGLFDAFTLGMVAPYRATAMAYQQVDKNIALGVSEHLDDFASSVNGTTWKTWGAQDFESQFMQTINQSENLIHFNMTGPSGGMINAWQAVTEGAMGLKYSRATSWELYQLYSNPGAYGRTTFYYQGSVIPGPF